MNIIGISGRIGSGKDTVGMIIQYLTDVGSSYKSEHVPSFNAWLDNYQSTTCWQIVKFADALKDIVCILTGCTREQLEDVEFKNSYLPDEWSNSCSLLNCDVCAEDKVCKVKYENNKIIRLTYRQVLQRVGTDLLRNLLHENCWVNALFSKYKSAGFKEDMSKSDKDYISNWIITDVRFPNEAKAIKDRGGIIIRVDRYTNIDNTRPELGMNRRGAIYKTGNVINKEHPSEIALDGYSFDYIIDNNGTIEDLIEKVKDILIKEEVI